MLQYLFLMPRGNKRKTKATYKLNDLPRPTGGIIGRIKALSEGRRIQRPTPQERLDLLNYCVDMGMKEILHKKPKTERDQVAYKIIRGYPISTHNESRFYYELGGWKGKVRKWKNKPSIKKVVLTWEKDIKPTRRKVCVWYRGNKISRVKAILMEKGYIVDVCAYNHKAYSHGIAWINNRRNANKKMALIVREGPPFGLHIAKHDWQYIYYKEK